jgi:CheY-like chemotaxis protein
MTEAPPPTAQSTTDDGLRGVSVLLVDDDADARAIVGAYLRYGGARVETAGNGREALEFLARARVDVLVIDYTMPGMVGTELLLEIRKLDSQAERPTPALLYTAFADLRSKAIAAGFAGYLRKPLDPRMLADEIARLAARV